MARMIPMKYADSATYTEKRLFNIFRTKLDSKHYGLSEVYLKNSRADFAIVGKETGIIVFEVKDWKFETIIGKRNGKFIMCSKGSTDRFSLDDPFDQLQKYRREIFDILVGNNIRIPKELQVDENKWYKFGIREALVLGGITKDEFYHRETEDGIPLAKSFNRRNIIFKDDLEAIEAGRRDLFDVIRKELRIPYVGHINVSDEWVNSVKKAFYQDRIIMGDVSDDMNFIQMDEEQGIAAHTFPYSNLLIRGSAGSGKTIVLMKRALILDSEIDADEKVLYTYFNRAIGSKIQNEINVIDPDNNIEFIHIDRLLAGIQPNTELQKYSYILVDEGQDFEKEQLLELKNFLKLSESGSIIGKMTICSDGGQNIYSRESFSYDELGLEFEVLELNHVYRSTQRIHQVATSALFDTSYGANILDEQKLVDYSVKENNYSRAGIPVSFIKSTGMDICTLLSEELKRLIDSGVMHHEIAVVCFYNKKINDLSTKITEFNFVKLDEKYLVDSTSDNICISTINSIKGYEFRNIILCDFADNKVVDKVQFPRKFYVALTRAIAECTVIISPNDHSLVQELSEKKFDDVQNLEVLDNNDESDRNENLVVKMTELETTNNKLLAENEKLLGINGRLSIEKGNLEKELEKKRANKRSFWKPVFAAVFLLICVLGIASRFNFNEGSVDNEVAFDKDAIINKSEDVLYQIRLKENAYVDYMSDGKNTYRCGEEAGEILDGMYSKGTIVTVKKDDTGYAFVVNGTHITNDHMHIEETYHIEGGRFAIGVSSESAEERNAIDKNYTEIDKNLMNNNGVYFTYLYTADVAEDKIGHIYHERQ